MPPSYATIVFLNWRIDCCFQCGGDARVAYSGRAACEAAAAAGTKKQLLAAGINDDDIFKQLDATNLSRHFSTQSESEYGPTDLILVIRDTHPGIPSNNKAIQQLTGTIFILKDR